jgi:hypothetical protein
MKTNRTIHVLLAGIGVASLLVYVLACSTAFSPDDRQVLYPSFDPQSGALSIAVYDRSTGRSEQIFSGIGSHTDTNIHSASLRAGWLPDGKHILVAQAEEHDRLSLFVIPRGVKEPIRHIGNLEWDEPTTVLQFPFAVAGTKVFLNGDHGFARVDWVTGEVQVNSNKIAVLPGDDGKTIVSWRELTDNGGAEFGVLDPETLAFQPQLTLTNQMGEGAFPAFHPREREFMFVSGRDTNQEFQIVRDGVKKFSRTITRPGCEVKAAGLWPDLGPKKDRVFTSYISQAEGQTNYECGLLEIPLNEKPLRFTPLFQVQSEEMISLLAQPSLSHDGKTWAISSAWLGAKKKSALRPEDCALFLVQLDRSQPKITKVPIVLPAVEDEGLK